MAEIERRFVEVVRKLDEFRFCPKKDWGELGWNIFHGDDPAATRLLLMWLCSAIDQFYPYTIIWTKGEKAMMELLARYKDSFEDVKGVVKNNKVRLPGGGDFTFVRDYNERLGRTFEFLGRKYSGSLPRFLASIVGDPKIQGEEGITKCTYFISRGLFDFKEPFEIEYPSDKDLQIFKGLHRKRVWMFVMFLRREPPVLNLLKEALIEAMGEKEGIRVYSNWVDPKLFNPLELQLPSDMWNMRLFKALGEKVGIEGKKAKREAERLGKKYKISPSAFDVTFAIGADRCSEKDCGRCPFGDNSLCNKGAQRDCNVLNWLHYFFDYKFPCNHPECAIGKDYGKGLCSREMDVMLSH